VLSCTGSSYSAVVTSTNSDYISNCRIVGVTGSSGNRDGLTFAGTNIVFVAEGITIIGCGGRGFVYTGTSTVVPVRLRNCTIAGNGGDGVTFPNTASQLSRQYIDHCMITGNGGYGINPGGANTNVVVTQTRLRDNTSGSFNTFGNYPQDYDIYTTDSDDATEYVDSGAGNYQIKSGATIHGSGYGVSEQAASGSAGPSFSKAGNGPSFRSAV
jgi:hypothetical protein